MSYNVRIFWKKGSSEAFVDNQYSRSHTWTFDGGMEILDQGRFDTLFSAAVSFREMNGLFVK